MITSEELDSMEWSVAETSHEGFPIWYRWRLFRVDFPKELMPTRLNIFWQMSASNNDGLPTQEEFENMKLFEDRLVSAVESDCHSILSVVITTNAKREFVFHTSDPSGFVERLSEMPQEENRYPIKIIQNADPRWEYDDRVVAPAVI